MLSQTKMQLWYPKKSSDSSPDRESSVFSKGKTERGQNTGVKDDSPALSDISDGNEEINVEYLSEDDSSRLPSDCEEEMEKKRKKSSDMDMEVSDFIDLSYWKKETLCCGTIFRGMYDEILVDPRFFKPCKNFFLCRLDKIESDINVSD